MRVILALVLSLAATSAHAADPWGDRLRQVFPQAKVIETFDDLKPWLAPRVGSCLATGLPVKTDGSPSQVYYYTEFGAVDTDFAIKDHGPSNSVTGQSLRLSWVNEPRVNGISHLAYHWGNGSATDGLTEMYAFFRFKIPYNSLPTFIDKTVVPKKGYYDPAATAYAGLNKLAAFSHGMTAPNRWNGVSFGASNTFPREPYGASAVVPHVKYANWWGVPLMNQLTIEDNDYGSANWPLGCVAGTEGCGRGFEQPQWYDTLSNNLDRSGTNGEKRSIQVDVWAALEIRAKLVDDAMGADDLQIWYYTPEGVKTELSNQTGTAWLHNIVISKGHKWNTMFLGGNTSSAYAALDASMEGHFFSDDLIINNAPIGDAYFAELAAYQGGGTVVVRPATYYVSPTGNDSNDGKTPTTAWQTISHVNTVDFVAGDVIRFANGDYGTTTLTPKTSGSADALITFSSYAGAATKPILRGGVNLTGRNHVKIDDLDISSSGNAVMISAGSYNVVTNCKLHSSATAWVHAVQLRNGAHYNEISHNTITQASGNNDLVNLRNDANHNLIAYNDITIENSHAAIDLEGYTVDDGNTPITDRSTNWNIVRGNTITGHNGGGALINLNANSNYNTVDNNILKGDNTVSSYCNLTSQPALHQDMFKLVGEYNIARNNALSNYPCKDAMGLEMSPYGPYDGFTNNSVYQHVYHNVITGIGVGATPLYLFGDNGGQMHDNVIKNNIIYNNGGTYWQTDSNGSLPADTADLQLRDSNGTSFFTNNLIYKSGYSGALAWVGGNRYTVAQADSSSANWNGNLSADPQLDTATLLPTVGSPALNAGTSLTTIASSSGTGTSFTVADAYYFCDGNGVTTGDVIEVDNQPTTITDITYGSGLTGTLHVSPAVTWTQGMAVNLPFTGTAPPVGLSLPPAQIDPPPVSYAQPGEGYPMPIRLSASEPTAAIYYTLDGTDPRTSPTRNTYLGDPIIINVTTTLTFYAQDLAGNAEEPHSVTYTITMSEKPREPVVKASGRFKVR